jgi:thiol:disulfide interchange protein DsbD
MKLLRLLLPLLLFVFAAPAWAQEDDAAVQWTARLEPADARVGEAAQIVVEAAIREGWHVYAPVNWKPVYGIKVELAEGSPFEAAGEIIEAPGPWKEDKAFGQWVKTYEGAVALGLPVRLKSAADSAQVKVTSQACDDRVCEDPREYDLTIPIQPLAGEPRPDRMEPSDQPPAQPAGYIEPSPEEAERPAAAVPPGAEDGGGPAEGGPVDETAAGIDEAKGRGLLAYMLVAFLAGLAALATPCVWPMIPITVSFFSKQQGREGIQAAGLYSLGIVGTFTGIGVAVSAIFGATGVQDIAANPWVNGFLAILFIVLALNLFGAYEIAVPSWVINRIQKGQKRGGWIAPILMGFAFSLTSFTCTVPFAGTVLAGAAQGDYLFPTMGMLAFSVAFALPFFFLALFPQALSRMPKSGSWLQSTKIYLGFIELMAAMKFISNIDLALGWRLVTFEVFAAIWVALLGLASAYLMGWVSLPTELSRSKPSWVRRGIGIASFAGVAFLLLGMRGNSLGSLVAFFPPRPYPGMEQAGMAGVGGIEWRRSLDEGIDEAESEGRLLFLNFTGVTCVNCRQMEQNVFPVPAVKERIEAMVPVELYTDRGTEEDRANGRLRQELTKVATNPVYVVLTPERKVVKIFQGLAESPEKFAEFLDEAKALARRENDGQLVSRR